ncbi:OX2R-like protein [Mya arenaria]|uniref:OX2R-like protein n=1 Tax=Mya arenaria TaxID=6604 RepID=A0ABY7GCP4_MYAAR|nr:orexin receptor type 2-like isoform X1 [Mya arenaria]WAR31845.1 OX2R-like protein [Mya arenaria]
MMISAKFIALACMLSAFTLCGVIGNCMVLFIYHQRKRTSATFFIMTLAATDLFTSLTLIPFTIVAELFSNELPYDFLCKVLMFLVVNNVQFSVFLIAVIAIDRYLCICHPFLNGNTVFRAKGTVVCAMILAGTFGVLTSLNYSVETIYISDDTNMSLNGTQNIFKTANFTQLDLPFNCSSNQTTNCGNNAGLNGSRNLIVHRTMCQTNVFFGDYYLYIYRYVYASTFIVSVVIVNICYGLIYCHLHRHRVRLRKILAMSSKIRQKKRIGEAVACSKNSPCIGSSVPSPAKESTTENEPKHKKLTTERTSVLLMNVRTAFMLFIVTVLFLATYLPAWLMSFELIDFNLCVFYLYLINHATNPIIYAFMSKDFRQDIKRLLLKCC